MSQISSLSSKKPLLVFDGDCRFCRGWIARWRLLTGKKIEYAPYQQVSVNLTKIPLKEFQRYIHLFMPNEDVFRGAEAVFRALDYANQKKWLLKLYKSLPGFAWISELVYSLVAMNRPFFSWLTKLAWGDELFSGDYFISRWFYLKALAFIYFLAFWSLCIQIVGLVGTEGILPAEPFLNAVSERYGAERFMLLPTVFWLNASNIALMAVCVAGMVFSVVLITGWITPVALAILWGLYLSLYSVGRVFLGFQWDILLLEVGFLSIFLPTLQIKPNHGREAIPSKLVLFLFHLLLFKLMFSSGMVKILSGDETWRNLTAMSFHYETQPIPSWTSWYAHQLPGWIQKASTFFMFVLELVLPFFIFTPRRLRYAAFFGLVGLQLLIVGTGNYGFFNWLSIVLCLLLLDDTFWPQWIRRPFQEKRDWCKDFPAMAWPRFIVIGVAAVLLLLNAVLWPYRLHVRIPWPKPVFDLVKVLSPYHLVGTYGLFAVMTTERPEIIVEGSQDGRVWKAYEFKYKPGALDRPPVFVAPHQPRLDWQMWFAALGTARQNPWFINFCFQLLRGSKPVLNLLETNPFPDDPPVYIRARMLDYRFTNRKERSQTGAWWKADNERGYLPEITFRQTQQ